MKRIPSWITIVFLASIVLISSADRSTSPRLPLPDKKECDCSNLKALQAELRTATRAQQNYRNEVAVLRGMDNYHSRVEFANFARGNGPGTARADTANTETYTYTGKGDSFRGVPHPASEECEMEEQSKQDYERMLNAAICAGIARALQAHEEFHIHTCIAAGLWDTYTLRHGADKAQEEVDAYGAEIAVLRAEIAKVLEKAQLHVIIEVNTRMQMPANPLYSAINITNKADISMNPPSVVGELFRFEGSGSQETNGSIEGNCHFNSGLPMSLPARATIETDLTDAKLNYNVSGTAPSMTMECRLNNQTGQGMSFPVPINNKSQYDFSLLFENGVTKEFDQGSGEAAQIMARGGAKMSGKGTVKLVFCDTPK